MNRFHPQPDRSCLEDLSTPVSHFASCHREHEFMFRQLAQTHRQELQVDPSIWERTANVWAGNAARTRASLVRLMATFSGKCASVAAMVLLVAGLHLLPAPAKPVAPTSEQPATASTPDNDVEQTAVATARQKTDKNDATPTDAAAAPAPATSASTPASSSTNSAITAPETAPDAPQPAPNPSEPGSETPPSSSSSNLISAEVLADEDPLVQVSLPGVSVKLL